MSREGGVIVLILKEAARQKAADHKARGVHCMAEPNGAELEQIRRLIDAGQVTPAVDRVFPLADLAQAQTTLEHDHIRR